MNKELTALEDIILYLNANEPKGLYVENIIIIKSALKRLQEIDTNTIPNMKERYNECNIERIIVRNERAKLYKENEKKLKALEIIKENLVVSYDESENDKPCLVIGFKVDKDKMAIIYHTFDKEKIDLLKEVLL